MNKQIALLDEKYKKEITVPGVRNGTHSNKGMPWTVAEKVFKTNHSCRL